MQAVVALGNLSARWTPQTYDAICREGYGRNPYIYSAIRQIAMAFAGLKWDVFSDREKTKKLSDHPLKLLLERPNPRQGKSQFMENVSAYLSLDGNSFIQRVGPDGKPPLELYSLRPDRVVAIPGNPMNPIAGYIYAIGNVKVPLPTETIRHLKTFNPLDDWRGLSPLAAAAMSVDQSNASKAWNVALLQNGARPPGALSTTSSLSPDQYQRLKELIQEEYAGFLNAGRPLLLEGGVTWQDMGMTPADMSWGEGQRLSAREIAIVYSIAPELLGDSTNKTYSNYGEARVALYQENVLPFADWVRDELNAWLSPLYDDNPYVDYDSEDIEALQEDRNALWMRATQAFMAGYITINQANQMVGMPLVPDIGDLYRWQLPLPPPAGTSTAGAIQMSDVDGEPIIPSLSSPAPENTSPSSGEGGGITLPGIPPTVPSLPGENPPINNPGEPPQTIDLGKTRHKRPTPDVRPPLIFARGRAQRYGT